MTLRPIFLMARRPNRMPCGVTVKTISLWLISGGSTGISSRVHSSMYSMSLGGGIQYAGHQGRHVFPGVVPFEIGGLISHHSIAGGVGFIEGVGREAAHLIKDAVGHGLGDAIGGAAGDEVPALLFHDIGFFLLMARRTRSAWP